MDFSPKSNLLSASKAHGSILPPSEIYYIKLRDQTFRAYVKSNYRSDGTLFFKSIQFGGEFSKCVNIVISFDANGQPTKAKIPHILSEPECGLLKMLAEGDTVKMVKAGIQFAAYIVPGLKIFEFQDMSRIDCMKDEQVGLPGFRQMVRPIPLNSFYIALNGMTWYEKHFGAKLIDSKMYNLYKERVKILYNPKIKAEYDWDKIREGAHFVTDNDDYLEEIYKGSRTFNDFFNNIPKEQRCFVLEGWLESFIKYWLKESLTYDGWYIHIDGFTHVPITISESPYMSGGSKRSRTKTRRIRGNAKNKTKRQQLYYRIVDNKSYF